MPGKSITVVFRYDDYPGQSLPDVEALILRAFQSCGLRVTYGIVPLLCTGDPGDPRPQALSPLTPSQVQLVADAVRSGEVEVALHGYTHQTRTAENRTEFSGLTRDEQVLRIAEGKRLLQELLEMPVTTFIPPFNEYDSNTVRALEECGFTTLSAGCRCLAEAPSKVGYLPRTCRIDRLRDAISAARASACRLSIVVVNFHNYELREVDSHRGVVTYDELCGLLRWVARQEDVDTRTIREVALAGHDLSIARYKSFCSLDPQSGVYWSRAALRKIRYSRAKRRPAMRVLCMFAFPAALFVIVRAAASALLPGSQHLVGWLAYGALLLLAAIAAYALRRFRPSYKAALTVMCLAGACAGIWSAWTAVSQKQEEGNVPPVSSSARQRP